MYDYYGCSDPMTDLLEVLCCTKEECLEKADAMINNGAGGYQERVARIYCEYSYDEKYVSYLKSNLAKSSEVYLELIEYYNFHGNTEEAIKVANEALDKCRDSKTTEVFAFLIKEAYKAGNKTYANKLYSRAKRRNNVSISELNKACEV